MSVILPDGTLTGISRHAADRWCQRIDPECPLPSAFTQAETELRRAIRVPLAQARRYFPEQNFHAGTTFYATHRALFLIQDGYVLTIVGLEASIGRALARVLPRGMWQTARAQEMAL